MCFLYSQFFLFTFFPVHSICAYFLLFFLYSQFFLCRFFPVHSLCAYFLFTIVSVAGCTWWRGTLQEASMLSLDKKRKKRKEINSQSCHLQAHVVTSKEEEKQRKKERKRNQRKSEHVRMLSLLRWFLFLSFSLFSFLFLLDIQRGGKGNPKP